MPDPIASTRDADATQDGPLQKTLRAVADLG